jgi:hypothetical protein
MFPSSGAAPKVNTNASMVYWSGYLLFYGGYYNQSFLDKQQTTILRKYDFVTQTWTIFQNSEHEAISEFGMLVYQDTLFTFLGNTVNDFYLYKLKLNSASPTWEELSWYYYDMFPLYSYAMDEHNGTVWFFGGWTGDSHSDFLDIWNLMWSVDLCKPYTAVLEITFEVKSYGYDAISPRAGHSLIPVAGKLLTFGN